MSCGIAVFDFDKTLIEQGSLKFILMELVGRRRLAAAAAAAAAPALFANGARRHEIFRIRLLRHTLTGVALADICAAAATIYPKLDWKADILQALERHKAAGRRILIATGGLSCYMPVLLDLGGVAADGLLATDMVVRPDGRLSGEMAAPSCTWDEKARRVRAWMSEAGSCDDESWGYGNLPNDGAMLALVRHPTAVPA